MKLAGAVRNSYSYNFVINNLYKFWFLFSGAGSISVLIDVNEGKDASDNTFTFNILATSPAFGSLRKGGKIYYS